jgi:chemotaxis protein methyltransferase CheR
MDSLLDDTLFSEFRNLIYDQSGIHFTDSNRPILESRLRDRLRLAKLDQARDYLTLLHQSPQELRDFLDSVTTNLTRFYRNQGQFDALADVVVSDLVKYKRLSGKNTIKLWSAGCSTGEEPYTMAMVMEKSLPKDFTYSITASDLSLKSLMHASQGFYPTMKIEGIPPEDLERFFIKMEGGYQVKEELKRKIAFDYHNLKYDSGLRDVDIVFCRNVLIYFDAPAQKNVIDRFWNSMSNHSYLFIGHSESLFGLDTRFKFMKTDSAVFYAKIID